MRRIVLLLGLVALLAGCGSSHKSAESTSSIPIVLPQSTTPDEWAQRVVNLLLRPLNRDVVVVNGFNSPDVRLYVIEQNKTTLAIIDKRLADLSLCTKRIGAIGPPPAGNARLTRVYTHLQNACKHYVSLSGTLKRAVVLLRSGNTTAVTQGLQVMREGKPDSAASAAELLAAIRAAQHIPAFRRAGLLPSA